MSSQTPAHFVLRPDPAPLPVSLTPLIGRERELTLARTLLGKPELRLLTITGPGGIGKTRLAIALAHAEATTYADGAAFVSLAPVTDVERVGVAIAHALGMIEIANSADPAVLGRMLRSAALLLVLDNFEHLTGAAPLLTDLLTTCPAIKIVVTSRALLRVTGEYALPVPPLDLPDRSASARSNEMEHFPAVRLFTDRARAIAPGFVLTEGTAPIVADICRHVDGMPLAIELAAAQSSILSPAELLSRIAARLPLPVAGPRDAPVRLRSMRDAVAWSYELLAVEEQTLFRRLGIFHGGFTLDAAEAIGRGSPAPGEATLDLVSSLVDKSLIRHDADEAAGRFMMLETIRGFALEELERSGETAAIAAAHAGWCLDLAERIDRDAVNIGHAPHLHRLAADYPNLQAALSWFHACGDGERLLRLTAALTEFWFARNLFAESLSWMETALASAPDAAGPPRARVMAELGRYLALRGEPERARLLVDAAAEIARRASDPATRAHVLIRQGVVVNRLGAYEEAEAILREALTLFEQQASIDPAFRAMMTGGILANIGTSLAFRRDHDAARAIWERSLDLSRSADYAPGIVRSLRDLGELTRLHGSHAAALAYYRECLARFHDYPSLPVLSTVLCGVASIAAGWHQPIPAARLLGAAEVFRDEYGGIFPQIAEQARVDEVRAAIETVPGFDAARAAGRRLTLSQVIDEIYALSSDGADAPEPAHPGAARLSRRELEVMQLLAAGKTDREIADALFLSVRTVEAHVRRILGKLGVHTRTAAVVAAINAGIAAPDPLTPDSSSGAGLSG